MGPRLWRRRRTSERMSEVGGQRSEGGGWGALGLGRRSGGGGSGGCCPRAAAAPREQSEGYEGGQRHYPQQPEGAGAVAAWRRGRGERRRGGRANREGAGVHEGERRVCASDPQGRPPVRQRKPRARDVRAAERREVDTEGHPPRGVEGVDEGRRLTAAVERVGPASVGAHGPRDRQALHLLVGLAWVHHWLRKESP